MARESGERVAREWLERVERARESERVLERVARESGERVARESGRESG